MNCYDVHVDNKGRLLLPKQIRGLFRQGARIVCDEYNGRMSLEPLIRGQVAAECEVAIPIDGLSEQAWEFHVAICPFGVSQEGLKIVRAYGQYNDVRTFFASIGIPEDDFEEYLIREGE